MKVFTQEFTFEAISIGLCLVRLGFFLLNLGIMSNMFLVIITIFNTVYVVFHGLLYKIVCVLVADILVAESDLNLLQVLIFSLSFGGKIM